jgi:hypothetical protein
VVLTALLLAMTAATPAWAGDVEDCSNVEKLAKTDPARVLAEAGATVPNQRSRQHKTLA